MTGAEIMAVVGFGLTLFGAVFGVWKYLDGKLTAARRDTDAVAKDLAAHRLHVAETYITKQGMRETTEQIMDAIQGVKAAVDHMTMRVDRIVESQAKTRALRVS